MARSTFAAVALCMIGASNALEVITPSMGLTVVAERTYTVEWTGAGSGRYEIDLYHTACGSMCMDEDCGDWVTTLCPYGDEGCPDNEGDYDIVMPAPMSGASSSGYKVRVADFSDPSSADCSDAFTLLAADEAVTDPNSAEYYLIVTTPAEGDVAMAGEEYTVEFDYMNGAGSKVDRFDIDLYMADGTGDCGTYYTTICDKPAIGCKDSMGDYDVEIPSETPSGMYKIRVGRHEDPALFGCSGEFEVMGDMEDEDSGSMSYMY